MFKELAWLKYSCRMDFNPEKKIGKSKYLYNIWIFQIISFSFWNEKKQHLDFSN